MPFSKDLLIGASGNQGAAGFYEYQIEQSLRMDAGSAMYLNRTLGTATSRKTFTVSVWVKRHSLAGQSDKSVIFTAGTSGSQYSYTSFDSGDNIEFDFQTTMTSMGDTDQIFRDFSSWYHIVFRWDTTQGTEANRFRVYVNGTQTTGLSLSNISQNENVAHWNAAENFYIGQKNGIGHAADGTNLYFAEVNFADGQSYAPTQFAEEKQGVWIPKDPSGTTYGNNGFHLKFADSSNFGTDSSGNGNDFSVTGLASSRQTTDSPTFSSD